MRSAGGRKRVNLRADALEVADRRDLSRRRARCGAQLHRCATGRARSSADGEARRDPKTELQEWAHQVGGGVPVYTIESREGPDHDPLFTVSVTAVAALSRRRAAAAPSGRPNRRRRRRSCSAKASGNRKAAHERNWPNGRADDAFRLRRADRRAQCRQIDAGQPAGRHQGVDRHPQGADDARHRPRHRHARQCADRVRSTRPASSSRSARSTGRW